MYPIVGACARSPNTLSCPTLMAVLPCSGIKSISALCLCAMWRVQMCRCSMVSSCPSCIWEQESALATSMARDLCPLGRRLDILHATVTLKALDTGHALQPEEGDARLTAFAEHTSPPGVAGATKALVCVRSNGPLRCSIAAPFLVPVVLFATPAAEHPIR